MYFFTDITLITEKEPQITAVESEESEDELLASGMVRVDEIPKQREMLKDSLARFKDELKDAQEINFEVQGWLNVPNTNISYPLPINTINECATHGVIDNCYYLTRTLDKKYAPERDEKAVVYVDTRCSLKSVDDMARNTVIYGHNWTNVQSQGSAAKIVDESDKMFAQLPSFSDIDFAKKTRYFTIDLDDGTQGIFMVFAVLYVDTYDPANPTGFYYINTEPTDDEFRAMISEARARSEHLYKIPVAVSDKIVTLSTCTIAYGNDGFQRFVVMGRMLRENEDIVDFPGPMANPLPRRPGQ